jgi:hypothetical protein
VKTQCQEISKIAALPMFINHDSRQIMPTFGIRGAVTCPAANWCLKVGC